MRVLIDECLDWRLARGLPGHTVTSVQRMGWSGVKNGRLLALAEQQFDVFITGDRNVSFQQEGLQLAVPGGAESASAKDARFNTNTRRIRNGPGVARPSRRLRASCARLI
jgi:hypothetical protein